jgi:hypothetical protein
MTERLIDYCFRGHGLFQRLREQRNSIGHAPGQDVRRAQGRSHHEEEGGEIRVLTDTHGPFE